MPSHDDTFSPTAGSGGYRRGNGLAAGTYLPLADLDPRVADAMLRLLHAEGIAAYASPSPGRVGGYLDVTPPPRPTDRLFVDLAQARRAREVVVRVIRESGGEPREGVDPPIADTPTPRPADRPGAVSDDRPGETAAHRRDVSSDDTDRSGDGGSTWRDDPTASGPDHPADLVDDDLTDAHRDDPAASGPHDPADRVDDDHTDQRRDDPAGSPADDDAVWQALVASFSIPSPSRTEGVPWPDAEDVPFRRRRDDSPWPGATGTTTSDDAPAGSAPGAPPTDRPGRRAAGPAHLTRPVGAVSAALCAPCAPCAPAPPVPAAPPAPAAFPSRAGGSAPAGGPAADPLEEEHFVPPPPPPIPRLSGTTGWAVLSLVGGAAVLIVPAMAGHAVSAGIGFLAVLAVLGGFVTLVARMRDAPPTDSGPDDGAVV